MDDIFLRADQLGIRLEIVGGLPIWEASPLLIHQVKVDAIRGSIRKSDDPTVDGEGCACLHYADIYVSFPDGSLKRPDISLFCRTPDEQSEAVTLLPEAVIEVISKGYEAKDLEIGLMFYLSQGVKDVIVVDPRTLLVIHARRDGTRRLTSPQTIALECGCVCEV